MRNPFKKSKPERNWASPRNLIGLGAALLVTGAGVFGLRRRRSNKASGSNEAS